MIKAVVLIVPMILCRTSILGRLTAGTAKSSESAGPPPMIPAEYPKVVLTIGTSSSVGIYSSSPIIDAVKHDVREFPPKNALKVSGGRIIKFKQDDSELFKIIGKGLENLESQSNGLLTP